MKTDTLTVDLNMPHKALQVIPQGALRLVCREGSVWITLDHDQRDVVLNPGEVFATRAQQRAIAYALESSVLRLEPVVCTRRAAAPRWRWWPQRSRQGGEHAGAALVPV
ncbi:DUF2917 domain-containing protein [Hydrogenophaga sp.]|uniref:DUF2917 domain-containing protein n=1 Tax=Hydrogenophaga sp. TaxID=1904254 RepID=UPI002FC7A4D6